MMPADFDPKNCPIGLVHEKDIEHTKDILNMAIQRLEEHIETIKTDVSTLSENVNDHFDSVDKRFDDLEEKLNKVQSDLPSKIDERIKINTGSKILNIVKWIVVTAGGSITISILTKLALQLFKLS